MRHKDRETMDKIVKIIEEYRMERSEIPSIGQIAEKVHMSRSTVYYYLRDMDNKGMIEYSARKMETPLTQKIRTLKTLGECDPKTGKHKLFYQNEQAYPGKYILASLSSIQGVAKHVIKAL